MHHQAVLLLLAAVLPDALSMRWVDADQMPMEIPSSELRSNVRARPRYLHGRFLHLTDLHPDLHYSSKSSVERACHGKKSKQKSDRAGYWGSPFTECDAPWRLTNFTLDYLDENWADQVDFVIWTGDNARHDIDPKIPRTLNEIYESNRMMARKMASVFTARGIPVIPSLGNNDVWPHNIMFPGPNPITNTYTNIWKDFVPFSATQIFRRGAYYSKEVIPGSVAVIALNTMYFYDSNKAIDGCGPQEPNDPGNLQLDWLEVQLESWRTKGFYVWLTGHVPPSVKDYFPDCYTRYLELSMRYQDTILGHLYGHLNVDHFKLLDSADLEIKSQASIFKKKGLFQFLMNQYSGIPSKSKETDLNRFGIVNVSPPGVPSPYEATFRVYSYNVTNTSKLDTPPRERPAPIPAPHYIANRKKCQQPEYAQTWKCLLNQPWHADPQSPSRTNQLWTPLGYAQYFLPNLDSRTKSQIPKVKLEYLTYPLDALHPRNDSDVEGFRYPIPLSLLPRKLQEPYKLKSKYTPYGLPDLTIVSWIDFARELAKLESKKLRSIYLDFMYMGGEE